MRTIVVFILFTAVLPSQTVTLRKPDGTNWTGELRNHPRVLISDSVDARIKDQDGDGPLQAPLLSRSPLPPWIDAAWKALHLTVASDKSDDRYLYETLLYTSIGYYMDHNASFSGNHRQCTAGKLEGSVSDMVTTSGVTYHDCYKWYALDAMRTWAARRPDSGSCFISGNQCGQDPTSSEDLSYMGEDLAYTGMAYSIMRSLMAQQERDTFMAYQLNGSLPPSPTHAGCVNRIPDRPAYTGKFTFDAEDKYTCTGKYGTTKTPFTAVWTGEPLPSSLVGKNIFFHQKSGLSTFTNQTQVTIATPGYTAARVHCWDSSGTKITPSSSAFAANLTTVTFSALQSGTCTANIKMATRNGSFGVVLSVNPGADTFTFDSCSARSGMENQLYLVSDAGPQSCGYSFNAVHYGNAPAYVAGQAYTSLSSPALPGDTTISVADASGFPTVYPFYVAIGDDNDKEMLKVTDTSGYTLTVDRGVYETVARGWPSGAPIFWKYTSHITDNNGWNNRNVTKQQGFLGQALAFCQDSQYACDLLTAAVDFWRANTYLAGHKYYGLITNGLIAYGLSRQLHNWSPMVQMLYTATNGAVDYRDIWMREGMALFYPYLSVPWDQNRLMVMGQTADNCKSLTGSAEGNCLEPIIHAQEFLRGTPEAKYAWKFALDSGRITDTNDLKSNNRNVLSILLFTDGTETGADWKTALPSHIISTQSGNYATDPSTNLSMAVSKTSWGSEATYAQMIAPDGFGEKWVDVPMGHYILGKAGDWFIGNASNLPYSWIDLTHARNYYDSYEWNQNTVVIGNPRSFQKNGSSPNIVTTADFDQEIDKRKSDNTPGAGAYLYVRVNSKDGLNSSKLGFSITRRYRHFAHFKPVGGIEHFVVYDDIGTSAPALIRAQIPYNNNGQTSPNLKTYPQEGWTNISPDGKQVVSTSYTGTHKLITDIIRGGRQYVSDINAEYSGNVLSICYDCTPTHPAHLVSGGKSWTYPAPMTASFATTTGGVWFFWIDPADGSFHGAPKTGYSISACTGPISCDAPISDWPSGAIRISKLSTISPCPGSFGGTNGSEDYHCRGYQDAHGVYLGEGYAVTSGDILVTHQITPVANTPDPATEITSISPDFVGVQIGGVNPKVAVFGKGTDTATFNESAFTTTHAGTAQYLVSGLNPGIYDITRDGVTIRSGISVSGSDGAVYFESVKGRFSIFQSGTLPGLVVSTSSLPDAVVQQAYSQALAASGGAPPYTWSIDSGSLPAGLSLGVGGSITGVPPTSGTRMFVARVTDSTSTHATRSITLNVVPSNTVHITTTGLPRATNGVAYDASLSAIGGTPPYRWTLTGGALPTGLSMTQGGTIQGQPAAAGSWSFTVKVTDALETTDFHAYTLVVDAATVPLSITSPATLPMIMLGDAYNFTLEAVGGTAPYSWTITGGSLPPDIALTSTTAGTLAGAPTAVGAYSFTAQVTDSQSGSASQQFALVVSGTEPLVLDSQSMPRGFVGQNYSFTLSASGGTPPYSWSITGSLPAGLTFDPSSGVITGVPQTVADSPIEVTVTDAGGTTAEADFVSSTLRFIAANNIEVSPLTRQVLIKYGFTGLPAEVACSLEAKSTDASGPVVSSTVDHGGPSRRIAVLSNLDPAAIHSVELRCQDFGGRKAFRTRGSDPRMSVAVGAADLKVQMVAPPGLAATQLLLEYGADPVTFGSTVTTPCAGRCVATINVSPDSIVYLQPKWLNTQGQILTAGSIKIIAVP